MKKYLTRFNKKVEKTDSCWLWVGKKMIDGYGNMWVEGKQIPAHRLSWLLHNGSIKEGLKVCHKCDVRHCVNPQHLFLGTQMDNMRDMIEKGRARKVRGSQQWQAKLDERKVLEIRQFIKEGVTQISIARSLGLDQSTISYAARGLTWKHI